MSVARRDWKTVRIPQVCYFQEGPGLRKWQWSESGIKVINGTNIRQDGIFDPSNTDKFLSGKEFSERYRHFEIEENDIVVSSSGTIGKVARVGIQHLPMMMNTSVIRFRSLDQNVLDGDFLYAFLRSPRFKEQAASFATGAAQQNFGPSHVQRMEIDLPPLTVQRKIAKVVSTYDDLIQVNIDKIATLEEIGSSLFEEWFVKFRFAGRKSVRLVETPLGLLPDDWSVTSLEAYCQTITDGSHWSPASVARGKIMASVKDMRVWGFDLADCRHISEHDFEILVRNGCKPKSGDILVAKDGANLNKHTFLATEESELVLLSSIAIIRPKSETPREFLLALLKSSAVSDRIKRSVSGAAIPRIILKDFKRLLIPKPPTALQIRWAEVASPMHELCRKLSRANVVLRSARDLLLPKLISGEIDVASAGRDATDVMEKVAAE